MIVQVAAAPRRRLTMALFQSPLNGQRMIMGRQSVTLLGPRSPFPKQRTKQRVSKSPQFDFTH